jgi:tRNA uridine 5-carboxymethylaminomethyl modification enzyme
VDIAVVGAGHAGCEAALAAARLGLSTALVTLDRTRVAEMSCNPAIGGLGKSQIVRELDALGGEMGRAADASAIQFRRLNASKGPAIRARRVQCDLGEYAAWMRAAVESCPGLTLLEGHVVDLKVGPDGVEGVCLEDGRVLLARGVVLTTGTFLGGRLHLGLESKPGGRFGEPAAQGLTAALERRGFSTGRLKTGTPARLRAASVQLDGLQRQPSDRVVLAFSHEHPPRPMPPEVACHLTRTTPETHAIIREGLDRSPLYTGRIRGKGPRYCPSIEDKVVRFADRESHQVILEPTDRTQAVLYPNGISTSLPPDVQEHFVRSIPGLEEAELLRPGYAVEYDFVPPTQLLPSLEARRLPGLFLAGQINGTSGYEEAAGQGLLAGVNAARRVRGAPPVVLGRQEAYLGVMVDDLVTRGTEEPYRMFSSRAELRLLLREDNAAARLHAWAGRIGLLSPEALEARRARLQQVEALLDRLEQTRAEGEAGRPSLARVLRRPGVQLEELLPQLGIETGQDVLEQAEVSIKYEGYIARQQREAEKLSRLAERPLPAGLDYASIPGISREISSKLSAIRPISFAQAARVDGMTPAALMVLSIWLDHRACVPRGTSSREEEA